MAKGDKKKVETQIQTQGDRSQTGLDQVRGNTLNPEHSQMWSNYQGAVNQGNKDYGNIMQGYQDFANKGPAVNFSPVDTATANYTRSPEMNAAMGTFKEFADTGGYNDQQISDLRARGVSPLRSVYANAVQGLQRQRSLQGGYSPNYTAAVSKMSGQLGSQLADQTTNINAGLAEAVNRGRLSGAQGLGSLSSQDAELGTRTALANAASKNQVGMFNSSQGANAQQMNAGLSLEGLAGQRSLYGTSPAAAATFGNQVLDSSGQLLNAQGQQSQLGNQVVNQQTQAAQLPSNFDTALGRAGRIAQIGSSVMNPMLAARNGLGTPGGYLGGVNPEDIFKGGTVGF